MSDDKPTPRPRHAKAELLAATDRLTELATEAGLETTAAPERPLRTTEAAPVELHTREGKGRRKRAPECRTPGCLPGTPATRPAEAPEQCAAHYDTRRGDVAPAELED